MKKIALTLLTLLLVCPQAKAKNITWGNVAMIGAAAIGGAVIAMDYYFYPPLDDHVSSHPASAQRLYNLRAPSLTPNHYALQKQ